MSSLKSFKLSQLAEILGAEVEGDPNKEIFGIGALINSTDQDISFIARESYISQLVTTKAGAVICDSNISKIYESLIKSRPPSVKGQFLEKMTISSTMGPGVKINVNSIG